jgi:hypothetical protein
MLNGREVGQVNIKVVKGFARERAEITDLPQLFQSFAIHAPGILGTAEQLTEVFVVNGQVVAHVAQAAAKRHAAAERAFFVRADVTRG